MVKIAIAGGSGQVAREIVDVLLATKKHEIVLLTRSDSGHEAIPGATWATVRYDSQEQLAGALAGVHTVLSFIVAHQDPGSVAQKTLVDAAVRAGVKRFAPSEWASSKFDEMPWYGSKQIIRDYLVEINKDRKVLEYSLFQPGLLLDYLAGPYLAAKHLQPLETRFDFANRRAILLAGHDGLITFTSLRDLGSIVARAVEYQGEWPAVGGIQGNTVTDVELVAIGARVRGKPFEITTVTEADVRAGAVKTSWKPGFSHPSLPPEQREQFGDVVLGGSLLSAIPASWAVSDEWNRIFADYKFDGIEEFLRKVWAGKP